MNKLFIKFFVHIKDDVLGSKVVQIKIIKFVLDLHDLLMFESVTIDINTQRFIRPSLIVIITTFLLFFIILKSIYI